MKQYLRILAVASVLVSLATVANARTVYEGEKGSKTLSGADIDDGYQGATDPICKSMPELLRCIS